MKRILIMMMMILLMLLVGCNVYKNDGNINASGDDNKAEDADVDVIPGCIVGGNSLESYDPCYPQEMNWRNVVAIKNHQNKLCTGVLVNKKMILTAAHCLYGSSDSDLKDFIINTKVYVGDGNESSFNDENNWLKIKSVRKHDSFGDFTEEKLKNDVNWFDGPQRDIGYIILAKEANIADSELVKISTKEEIESIFSNNNNNNNKNGSKSNKRKNPKLRVRIVGFGIGSEKVSSKKKVGSITRGYNYKTSKLYIGDENKGTCSGDSGAPLFYKLPSGEWRIIAIASASPENCQEVSASVWDVFTLLGSDLLDWLSINNK
ncbi:MAG: trypsin-like serine protease [Oligoflexia bacterium]|nr:trypsin-like serine protease [Oligoflexia bacterium]